MLAAYALRGNCPAALRWHGPTRSAHDIHALASQAILLSHPQPRIYWLACLACLPHIRFVEIARRRFAGTGLHDRHMTSTPSPAITSATPYLLARLPGLLTAYALREIARRRFAGTGLHDRRMTSPPSPVRLFCYHPCPPVGRVRRQPPPGKIPARCPGPIYHLLC